jgi:Phage integrase family
MAANFLMFSGSIASILVLLDMLLTDRQKSSLSKWTLRQSNHLRDGRVRFAEFIEQLLSPEWKAHATLVVVIFSIFLTAGNALGLWLFGAKIEAVYIAAAMTFPIAIISTGTNLSIELVVCISFARSAKVQEGAIGEANFGLPHPFDDGADCFGPCLVDCSEIIVRTVYNPRSLKVMAKSRLRLVVPAAVNRTVPLRRPNAELRTREDLTDAEVARLTKAASGNRWGQRDAAMVLVAYRHGLRASELTDLRWDQIDFDTATLAVRRAKKGTPATHPIRGDELRALRKLAREQEPKSPFVFTSERGAPFTTAGFARMIERAGEAAKLGFKAHPHMLRHACGFALANKGHDTRALQAYLGHKNIQHTVRYTELSPTRFKDFWRQ